MLKNSFVPKKESLEDKKKDEFELSECTSIEKMIESMEITISPREEMQKQAYRLYSVIQDVKRNL